MAVGFVVEQTVRQPDDLIHSQVGAQRSLNGCAVEMRVAVAVEQAFFCGDQGAFAIDVNRTAFQHKPFGAIARRAFDLENLAADLRVTVPRCIQATVKTAQALKSQFTPRTSPLLLITKVWPVSRTQASSLDISTTRILGTSKRARAFSYWPAETATVTGSKRAMALATATCAACAGLPPRRQLSGRSGQIIQAWVCGAHSAGI